jgi:putative lipoprotein
MLSVRHFRRINDKEINMSNENTLSLSGKVHYLERIALAPNSTLYVSLQDVSLADSPAKTLAAQVIPHAERMGLNFNLQYNAADVVPGQTYAISAKIETAGELVFTSTDHHPVELSANRPTPFEVLVHLV